MTSEASVAAQGRDITLNGAALRTGAATLAELLAQQGYAASGAPMACAVNQRFVPRPQWEAHALQPGDAVEIVSPVVGG